MIDDNSGSGCLFPFWLILLILGGAIFFVRQTPTAGEITIESTQMQPADPAVEIVLSPVDADATSWQDLQEALLVIDRRLLALSTSGQIERGYTMDSSRPEMTLIIRFSAGTATTQDVVDVLLESGYIEFVDMSAVDSAILGDYADQAIATSASVERRAETSGRLVFPTILTHEDIVQAAATGVGTGDGPGGYMVQIDLTPEGAERLGTFSETHIGSGLAVVLDGVVLTVPIIQSRIETPVMLTGNFTEIEVVALAAQINSRPLPIDLRAQRITQILPPE